MKQARTRACGQAGWRVIGFGWEQAEPGVWVRYLIRKCKHCGGLDIEKLIWVDTNMNVCLACLSQRVASLVQFDPTRYHCLDCGATTWFLR